MSRLLTLARRRHFIDKYTQVARILKPIVLTLEWIETKYECKLRIERYINGSFGSLDNAKKVVAPLLARRSSMTLRPGADDSLRLFPLRL